MRLFAIGTCILIASCFVPFLLMLLGLSPHNVRIIDLLMIVTSGALQICGFLSEYLKFRREDKRWQKKHEENMEEIERLKSEMEKIETRKN
jgi:hypothetical protein